MLHQAKYALSNSINVSLVNDWYQVPRYRLSTCFRCLRHHLAFSTISPVCRPPLFFFGYLEIRLQDLLARPDLYKALRPVPLTPYRLSCHVHEMPSFVTRRAQLVYHHGRRRLIIGYIMGNIICRHPSCGRKSSQQSSMQHFLIISTA